MKPALIETSREEDFFAREYTELPSNRGNMIVRIVWRIPRRIQPVVKYLNR